MAAGFLSCLMRQKLENWASQQLSFWASQKLKNWAAEKLSFLASVCKGICLAMKRWLFFWLPSSGKQTIHQAFWKDLSFFVAFFRQANNTPSIFCFCLLSSKQSQKRKRIAVSPSGQDFTSIVSRIVFSTSSGEELGHSVSKSFIFVTPCVFRWMFHLAQMLKEMQFWHDVEICGIFLLVQHQH